MPEISFDGAYNFKIECDCSHSINVDIKYLKEKYLINKVKDLDKNFYKYRKCRKHSLKYYAHCFDCSKDICEQCLSEEEELHETHEMLIYPNFNLLISTQPLIHCLTPSNTGFLSVRDQRWWGRRVRRVSSPHHRERESSHECSAAAKSRFPLANHFGLHSAQKSDRQ